MEEDFYSDTYIEVNNGLSGGATPDLEQGGSSPCPSTSSLTFSSSKKRKTFDESITSKQSKRGDCPPPATGGYATPHCHASNSPSDEAADFARVVANELRAMGALQRRIAKKVIYEALYMGAMDTLHASATVRNDK